LRSVTLEDHVALKESSLRNTRVGLLGLSNHDGLIFKVVEDNGLANSEVFKSWFNDAFLRVSVESEDLLVELDVGRFELLSNLSTASEVVRELSVRKRLRSFSFIRSEVSLGRLGNGVQRDSGVLVVSDLLKVNMRDLVVSNNSGVVVDDVTG
jgi:hypothetical protein